MIKFITLSLVLLLSACSNNQQSSPPVDNPTEEIYNLDANGIGFFSGSPLSEHTTEVSLGSVNQGQRKSIDLTIKNMGSSAYPMSSVSLSNTNFYITRAICANAMLMPGASCTLTVNFSAIGKAVQPFEAILNFGNGVVNASIPVRIGVLSSSSGSTGSAVVKMYDGTTLISSPPDYSIGTVSGTAKISKVITIKNEGTAATLIGDATLSSSDFYLTSNSCSGKALALNASCSATVNFSATGKSPSTKITTLSFGGSQVSLSATIQAPPSPPAAQLVFMDGATELIEELSLGQHSNNVTLSKTLSIKNVGGSKSSTLSLQLLNNSAGYFTVSNSCNNVALAAGSSCSFTLRVSTNKPTGKHSVNLKMDQATQIVSFEKMGVSSYTLSLTIAGPGGVTINGTTYGSGSTHTISFNSGNTPQLLLSGNPNSSGSFSGDCTGIDHCTLLINSNKSVTAIFACNDHHLLQGNDCAPNQYSISATKSAGGSVSGDVFGVMSVGEDSKLVNYSYVAGGSTVLVATPSEGYTFNSWGGDCYLSSSSPVCILPLDGNKGFSASFTINTYTMNYFLNNGAMGGMSGPGPTVVHGTNVSITATPNAGHRFVKWNGGPCDQSTDPVCSFVATGNVSMEGQLEVINGGEALQWVLSQPGNILPNGSNGGLTFASHSDWNNIARGHQSYVGDFTLVYDLSTHGVGGGGNGDIMLGYLPGYTDLIPLPEGHQGFYNRNAKLLYLDQGGVHSIGQGGPSNWYQPLSNVAATSDSSIIVTIQRVGSITSITVVVDGISTGTGVMSNTYTGVITPVLAVYNGFNETLNSATITGTPAPIPNLITVTLDVPAGSLMFTNNDASHGGDNNNPYYVECGNWNPGSNLNCTFNMEVGSNVVIELQQGAFQATGWINCPFNVEEGTSPGQLFCNLSSATENLTLGATGSYDPCYDDPWSCQVMGCTDSQAENYNPSATMDDGSCSYSQGCTDPAATNYDPSAMQEDGSCQYAATFNQIGTFAYSSGSGQPASCKAKGPFGQDQLMADLIIQGPFDENQKSDIQTAACNYLINSGSTQSQFSGMNQCTITDFGMFMQISQEVGIPQFMLSNNLIFDFSQYNVVPLEGSGDCDMWLNFGSPSFEMTGGGVSLTDGTMYYPVDLNNNLYYGVKGNSNGEFFYLVKSNKIDTVNLISTDYKLYLSTTFPMVVLDGKIFFQAKYQQETQFKLFYLDENDSIQEFLGQIPGYQYQGVRDNNLMRIISNGNYLLINRPGDSTHILKVTSATGPVVDIVNNINYDLYFGNQGEFIGNDYYAAEYNNNDLFKYLKKIDLTNNVITSISDSSNTSTYGFNKLRTDLPMGKTNQESKLWFLNTGVNQIISYEPATDSKQVYNLLGTGISWRIFGDTITYFSTFNGPTEHLYKISDAGLEYVGQEKINQGFISNNGDLVFSEVSGNSHNVYKINYGQSKTLLFPNKVMYTGQNAYITQNNRTSYPAPVYKNQAVVSMADISTSPFNITSNMKIVLINLDTLSITDTISVCSQEIGGSDMRLDFYNVKSTQEGLFLSVRTCGSQDYQLYKYQEGIAP